MIDMIECLHEEGIQNIILSLHVLLNGGCLTLIDYSCQTFSLPKK